MVGVAASSYAQNVQARNNNIPGINPQSTSSLADCVELCMYQGTVCTGVTWRPDTNQCYLKSSMNPTDDPGYVVNSVLRMSGPSGAASQLIVNGGFDGGTLAPWVSGTDSNGVSFVVQNGKAFKYFPLAAEAANDPWGMPGMGASESTSLSQALSAASTQVWYMSAYLDLSNSQAGTDTQCSVNVQAGSSAIWADSWYAVDYHGPIYASGKTSAAVTNFQINIYCNGEYDASVAYDDVLWNVFPPATGTNPIVAQPTQIVRDNDFSSGAFAPWTTDSTTGRMDFTISNGRATVTFARLSAQYNSPAWILQTISAQATQTYTCTANVWWTIPSGTRCSAQIYTGNDIMWSMTDVTTSGSVNVNNRGALTNDANYFYLYSNCQGTASATVQFDNVYLTLNT